MKIIKIAVTGGPCGGKTTALARLKALAESAGYRVLTVGETATELIGGGVAPWSCASNEVYQEFQMDLQTAKEEIFWRAATSMKTEKILILYDRGLPDNAAYMSGEVFDHLLMRRGETREGCLLRYDAVFHLVTAAEGAEAFYTTENNAARTETPEEARALDAKLLRAWEGHPHHYVIDNRGSFSDKMRQLEDALGAFLKEADV